MSRPPPLAVPRALLHPRHWPMWLGVAALWLLAQLPLPLQRAVGAAIGALAHVFARARREIAALNIALCYPELDADGRASLLERCFRSLGIGVFEFVRAWWGPLGALPRNSTFEGVEHIRAATAAGRGVILLSGHFMTLELCGRLLCGHVPVAGMYRRHGDPVLEWSVKRGRLRYAAGMFARDELRAAVRHLKAGGILWYAPDQDMRGKDVVFAPFFGVPAATITATHQLARLSGAAVIGFFHRRRADGRGYEIRIEPPLPDFPSDDPVADAAAVNALIERMVREAPDEYLWIHRRFKRRPEGEPRLYG
ncbi:MAG TPA: LpxL/LpxP family Kdo(2)-lipid IV(A) lauroyl/palmitoleoyl acyltransferase [Candidatus Saccharimonadia bacterium]|nr:LpxL/LpxP family Kdo(2)-lipid IV(A) lauroyl/palmitoleoyl acyltransferase [Candidatus Saccharimonadia bacterium]